VSIDYRKAGTIVCARPEGGYRLVSVMQLFVAWWAYRRKEIQFRDLRAYLALHEMAARRSAAGQGRTPRFTVTEVERLVGGGGKHVAGSLRRLGKSGLAAWSESAIRFAERPESVRFNTNGFQENFARIVNRRRRVPVPRRTLRLLARATRPVQVATILGHLFRCVYAKGCVVAATGSVSASWIAEAFEVDPRNVKRARAQLRAWGWLSVLESDHWHRQRYGERIMLNLSWDADTTKWGSESPKTPPRLRQNVPESPPPKKNRELLMEYENQKPGIAGPSGVSTKRDRTPTLQNVQVQDLTDISRLLMLFKEVQSRGLVRASESDRLRFVSAAVRTLDRAKWNPGGFFARLVRNRLWHYATAAHEARAQAMLKEHMFGSPRDNPAKPAARQQSGDMLFDIRLVSQTTQVASSHSYRGDPFELVAKQDARWTRERWDRAMRAWLTRTAVAP